MQSFSYEQQNQEIVLKSNSLENSILYFAELIITNKILQMSAKRGEFLVFTSDIEWAHWNVVMALNKWSSVTWHPGQLGCYYNIFLFMMFILNCWYIGL